MPSVSVVIPAYNERENLEALMAGVPVAALAAAGWSTEVLVFDNASTDGTGALAAALGARVLVQPVRGYGNAYKAGFSNAVGDVLACGDADLTYPFDALPALLAEFQADQLDFLTTDRLHPENQGAMSESHMFGNHVLSTLSRRIYHGGARDSQSGMWLLRRSAWSSLDVRSGGMAFSQEIKNEVLLRGLRWREVAIEYRHRGGEVKLNATRDGLRNLAQLVHHRYRRGDPRRATMQPGAPVLATPRLAGDDAVPDRGAVQKAVQEAVQEVVQSARSTDR